MTRCRLHAPGSLVGRVRELDNLPPGSIVQAADPNPSPCYFRRYGSGWLACTADGDTRLHAELWVTLDGWPTVLPTRDIRRPATVVVVPDHHVNDPAELHAQGVGV